MACPSAIVAKGRWPDGLSHQEAAQADGEEEAPQAAEEDADPAQEQEVAGRTLFLPSVASSDHRGYTGTKTVRRRGRCGSRGRASGVPAVSAAPRDGGLSGGQ